MENRVDYHENGRAIMHLSGRLDAATSQSMRKLLNDVITQGYDHVVINLKDVSFVDSSGLSAIVAGYRTARDQSGKLALVAVGAQAMVALKQTRLNQVLAIHENINAALAAFEESDEQ